MLNLQLVEASRNVTKLRADMQTLHCNSGALRDAVRVQRGLATEIAAGGVPDRYFEAIVDELEGRLHEYKKELNHIGEFMKARGERGNVSGKTIEDVIRRLYGYFMVVAGRVADVNENLKAVRELYVRVVEGENRGGGDCFERADLREKVERERERALTESFVTMEGGGQPVTAGVGGAIMVPGGGQTQMAGSGALGGSTWFNDASSSADAFGTNGNAGGQTKRLSGGRRKRN